MAEKQVFPSQEQTILRVIYPPALPGCLFKIWHFSAQEVIPFISVASLMRVSTTLSTEMKGHQEIKAGAGCELVLTTAGEKDGFVASGTWAY